MFLKKHLLLIIGLVFLSGMEMLIAQETTFRKGAITNPYNPVIANEQVSTVPFKNGVLIFSGERFATFIYYYDGVQSPTLIGHTGKNIIDVGPVPGGRVISSSGRDERTLQFISEADLSMTELEHPYGHNTAKTVAFPDFLLQFDVVSHNTLVVTRIGGIPIQSTEIFRTEAYNGFYDGPGYKVEGGRVIISTSNEAYLTDGTVNGTHHLVNHRGGSPQTVHFFAGEYYFWDKGRLELVIIEPTTGTIRSFAGPDFPSALAPWRINEMTVTPAGIVYIANTDAHTNGLFVSDGTIEGTYLLREFTEPRGFFGTNEFFDRDDHHPNGALVFLAKGAAGSLNELWQSDGTEAGTKKIRSIVPNPTSFNPTAIASDDTEYSYFYTSTEYASSTVEQLYGADLTAETLEFKLLEPGGFVLNPSTEYISNRDWFFYANSSNVTVGMQAYNLTENLRILYPNSIKPSLIDPLFIGSQVFLPVITAETGEEPGVFTLGDETITLLADLFPDSIGSNPSFFNIGETVFFLANNPVSGYGIYRTDGTTTGTSFLVDLHDRNQGRFLQGVVRIGDDLLVWEFDVANRILNQETDSLEEISASLIDFSREGVGGFFAYTSTWEGILEFASGSSSFMADSIFPNITRVTSPIAFGKEFAFLMTVNDVDRYLTFINPVERTGRRILLDENQTNGWSHSGMFVVADRLYFYQKEANGTGPFYRYDNENNLQRLSHSLASGERILVAVPGLNGANTIIRTYTTGVGSGHWLHDHTPDGLLNQGLHLIDENIYGFVTISDRLLVLTSKRLYLTNATNTLDLATDGLLVDETASDFTLASLTYISDDEILFLKTNSITSELWTTDGTTGGTRKLTEFGNPALHSSEHKPLPRIPGWLLIAVSGDLHRSFYLYNYESGYILKPSDNVTIYNAVGLGNRFYYIGSEIPGHHDLFYIEEINPKGDVGVVYEDENRNGLREPEERSLAGRKVRFQFPDEEILTFSSFEGRFQRYYSPEETYQVVIEPDVCWEATTEAIVNLNDNLLTPDFGMALRSDLYGLKTSVHAGPMRCGFDVPFWLVVTNTGCQDLTGITVEFRLDAEATFISADLTPDENLEERLRWNDVSLAAGETWRTRLLVTMPDETSTGRVVPFSVAASGRTDQGIVATETFTHQQTLRCAIDPNDKLVSPARPEASNSNYTQIDETLTYTIRFQNTGNDTALNVRLDDQLAAELDLNTFKPIAASHDYRIELDETGRLKVYFDDIFLPDSNVNETASHGFFAFDIALKEEGLNTAVENTAGIFFDFNAPVITNTVSNSIVEFLDEDQDTFFFWEECDDENPDINPAAIDVGGNGIDENCDGEDWTTSTQDPLQGVLQLFPNPTSGKLTLNYSLPGKLLATVFDGRGRRMQSKVLRSDGQLDLSGLPGAVFFLQVLEVATGRYTTRRVVKW